MNLTEPLSFRQNSERSPAKKKILPSKLGSIKTANQREQMANYGCLKYYLCHNCSSTIHSSVPLPMRTEIAITSYASPKTNIERGAFEPLKITMSIALSPILQVQSI